jgi:hypothetical protein
MVPAAGGSLVQVPGLGELEDIQCTINGAIYLNLLILKIVNPLVGCGKLGLQLNENIGDIHGS